MIQVSVEELAALYADLRDGLDSIARQATLLRANLPMGEVRVAADRIHDTALTLSARLRGIAR